MNFDLKTIDNNNDQNLVENLTLTGSAIIGDGNKFDNLIQYDGSTTLNLNLRGNEGEDTLIGSDGEDTLSGRDSSGFGQRFRDSLIGGNGDDTYSIDLMDVIVESEGQGNDTVRLDGVVAGFGQQVEYELDENLENLLIAASAQEVKATGNDQDNLISTQEGLSDHTLYQFALTLLQMKLANTRRMTSDV